MNKIALFLLTVPFLCFGCLAVRGENLKSAWALHRVGFQQEAIELLSGLIDDPSTEDLERLHYLNARCIFYWEAREKQHFVDDWNHMKALCDANPSFEMELQEYYGLSLDCPPIL
jgi:hypothetical protein